MHKKQNKLHKAMEEKNKERMMDKNILVFDFIMYRMYL